MLTILTIVTAIIWTLLVGLKHARSQDDFYRMRGEARLEQYRDTTVAYTLQLAVTVYFVYWGYAYGWANIYFIVTWFLGLLLFAAFSPRILLAIRRHKSLFEFLGNRSGKRTVPMLALITIISLAGLLYTEIFFASNYVANAVAAEQQTESVGVWFWFALIVFISVAVLYTGIGGARRVVVTDAIQLGAAYIGFALTIGSIYPTLAKSSDSILLAVGGVPIWIFLGIGFLSGRNRNAKGSAFCAHLSWIGLMIYLAYCLFAFTGRETGLRFPSGLFSQVSEPFGWAPILGFGLANLFWQLADYTAYYRLTLMSMPEDDKEAERKISKGIRMTMFSSPLTWGLGIALGMAIYSSEVVSPETLDVFGDFTRRTGERVAAGDIGGYVALIGLGVFVAAIIMSTMDSALMSLGNIIEMDLMKRDFGQVGRLVLFSAIGVVVVGIAIIHRVLAVDVLVFLGGFYSLFLVIAPIALCVYLRGRISPLTVYVGAICGVAGGLWFVVYPPETEYNLLLVLPMLSAMAISFGIVIVFEAIGAVWRTIKRTEK